MFLGEIALAPLSGFDSNPMGVLGGLFVMFIPFALFALIVGLIVFFIYHSYRQEKQRAAELQRVVEELGFDFLPDGDSAFLSNLSSFYLFSQGRSKRLSNLMRGKTKNLEVAIFDYKYVTGSGKHSHTWRQSVVCFHLDRPDLPVFCLRPESVFHKIGAWFGYQDINFTNSPVFSKNYLLQGKDEQAIRDLFTDEVLAFCEANLGISVEGGGDWLLFYRYAKRVEPPAIRSLLEDGLRALDIFHPAREEF